MIGEGGYLEQDIDGSEKRNEEDREPGKKLDGGESASRRKTEGSDDEVPDDEDDRSGDHLVEGVLEEAAEASPRRAIRVLGTMKNGTKIGPTSTQTAVAMKP